METPKEIYFNPAQQRIMQRQCNTTVVVGGRRLGKSHGIVAPFALRNVQYMPGSSGGYVGATFQQALTRTLPGTFKALADFGYKRNTHFVVGRRPDKKLNFRSPIIEPEKYDHVISWYNGSVQYIITQDGVGTSNSLTLDYGIFDEAKFLNAQKLREETFPAIGGNQSYFNKSQYYRSKLIVSDMPMTKKGSWFLDYEKEMDTDLIATIDGMIHYLWQIRERLKAEGASAPAYLRNDYKRISDKLAKFRRIAVDYNEFSSLENLEVLGEDYIRQQKRDLPPLVFMSAILCIKMRNSQSGFYNNLKESIHYYSKFNNDYLQGLEYNLDKAQSGTCQQDGDLDINAPICIAFDFNANINWCVAGQVQGQKLYIIKSFFVKYERKLVELVDDFCAYYRFQKRKHTVLYYDSTALDGSYAVVSDDFVTIIEKTLHKHGWFVERVYIGQPMKHHEKHRLINMCLKGDMGIMPMINRDNNEELILSVENAGVHIAESGFKKDKRGEKLVESEEDKLETRTDGSDAFDTLVIGVNNFKASSNTISGLVSTWG